MAAQTVAQIQRLIESKRAEAEALLNSATDTVLTEAQQSAWDTLMQAIDGLKQSLENRMKLDELSRRSAGVPLGGTGDRLFDGEIGKRYSLTRLLRHRAGLGGDAGFEMETSGELARRSGREPEGVLIPLSALGPVEKRVLTTAAPGFGPGGNLIATYLDPAQFIAPLYAALTVRQAGATVISGLSSNLDLPRQSQSVVGTWVAENSPLSFSDPGFDRVGLRPKHYGTITEFSRNMLMQTSPEVEDILRRDMSNVLARGLDAAAISGAGPASNQPLGLLAAGQGIGAVSLGPDGAHLTWGDVLALVASVEVANVGDDARAFIGNPLVKASLSQTLRVEGVAAGFIQDAPDQLAGFKYLSTTLMPSSGTKGTGTNLSSLIYGNWSDLVIGLWSEIDILVNPFESAAYQRGNVQIRAMMTTDIACRHPQSFAAVTDIVTT